ncbi:MAG: endonuclease/exonuclease/phosphatase family protein [Acidobacteriia bacterium]|nr:endonuclease/exonuclease/phosphatase family protein [Terriglobia bacterium]
MFHGELSKEIAQGLIELQTRIKKAQIPPSKLDETINIATWNIREFGKVKRSDAAIHYIAEILGQFDLIGVVELRDDLSDLGRVLPILGPYWRAIYSDMIPDSGGNRERIAFLYDKRSLTFGGFAAEANPPRKKVGNEYLSELSFWRSPYMASFRSGNFDFVVLSAHIRWGDSETSRKGELQLLADWVDEKRKEKTHEDKDLIIMGDFNIAGRDDELFKAITSRGLVIPQALRQLSFGTNLAKDKRYDQIFHLPIYPENFTNQGGVLDFHAGDHTPLFPGMSLRDFTYQLSDHLPLWMQVNTDIEGHQLDEVIRG